MPPPEDRERFERIRSCFEKALELSGEAEQDRYILETAGEEAAVLEEARRLLRNHRSIAPRVTESLPRFGPYQATRLVGRGGMGVVYEAHRCDGEFDRRVAVKVTNEGCFSGIQEFELRRERQTLAKLEHPGIARLFDGGVSENGSAYLVTEFIDGVHLDRYCDENRATAAERLKLILAVLDAVEYAHNCAIVHRDLKPSNIMVCDGGVVKLVDFGTARPISGDGHTTIATRTFTPDYASPELAMGKPVDARSDIYSLGVLYGKIMGKDARQSVLRKAAALSPDDRYATVAEFRRAMLAKPWPKALAASAGVLAVVSAVLWFRTGAPPGTLHAISKTGQWRSFNVSHDGKWMVFSTMAGTNSQSDIWIADGDGANAKPLFQDSPIDSDPAISPNAATVAFRSEREPPGIYEFDRQTSRIRLLQAGGRRPSYSPDGKWLLYSFANNSGDPGRRGGDLWRIMPAGGGLPIAIGKGLAGVHAVVWSADGSSLLIQEATSRNWAHFRLWKHDIGSGKLTVEAEPEDGVHKFDSISICAALPGGDTLLATDPGSASLVQFTYQPGQRLRDAVLQVAASLPAAASRCEVTADGRRYALLESRRVSRYSLDFAGRSLRETPAPRDEFFQSISEDASGEMLRDGFPGGSLWLRRGAETFRTEQSVGVLSGNGKVAWYHRKLPDGRSRTTVVDLQQPDTKREFDWATMLWSSSWDGSVALVHAPAGDRRSIALLKRANALTYPILVHPVWNLYRAVFSPDGRWIAATAVKEDESRWVVIAPFRGEHPVPLQEWVSVGEGSSQVFSPDGEMLYFLRADGGHQCIYRVGLDPKTRRPLGSAEAFAHFHGDVAPAHMPPATFILGASKTGLHFSLGQWQGQVVRID